MTTTPLEAEADETQEPEDVSEPGMHADESLASATLW